MDQTTTNTSATIPKRPDTAVERSAPASHRWPLFNYLEIAASLRITVVLFVLSLFLVFWGTLAQQDAGVWTVVNKYFRSFFVLVPIRVILFNCVENSDLVVPFPGGLLLGGVMLVNLLAAHIVRFKLTWSRCGILLIHAGIVVMMLGELVTYLFAIEGNMIIPVGQTVNHIIHHRFAELAVIRQIDAKEDEVVVVPASNLSTGAKIKDERLPFEVEVLEYMVNSKLIDPRPGNLANKGLGLHDMVVSTREVSGVDPNQTLDIPSAYVRLTRDGKDLGTWLLSAWISDYMNQVQELTVDGKVYQIALRYKQTYRPFYFHLTKFKHDVYPGTQIPKDYHCWIHLTDPSHGVDMPDVEIYMNAPLRYRGETFYQSQVGTDAQGRTTTTLQVVRNPGWLLPYFSCAIVGFGMLIHFGIALNRFINRRTVR